MGSLLLVAVSFYIFCAYVTLASSPWSKSDVEELLDSALSCTEGVFGNGSESWGQYSPYFPVDPYTAPPVGCEITQVGLLLLESLGSTIYLDRGTPSFVSVLGCHLWIYLS